MAVLVSSLITVNVLINVEPMPRAPKPPGPTLTDDAIAAALLPFKVQVTPGLASSIRKYIDLLLLWNHKVNLTSITDPEEILRRHFGESMFAAHSAFVETGRLADVGSGAGFPGLALKLLAPDLEVFLIESVMKKAPFLLEVVRHLNLPGVKVVVSRFEDLRDTLAPLDFICPLAPYRRGQTRHLASVCEPGHTANVSRKTLGRRELLARHPTPAHRTNLER